MKFRDLFTYKDPVRDFYEKQEIYPLSEMMAGLSAIPEKEFGKYAFFRDPLERRFSRERKQELTIRALECGSEYAQFTKKKYQDITAQLAAERLGVSVSYPERPSNGGQVLFARFTEPDKIEVYLDCVRKGELLVREYGLETVLGEIDIRELLLWHELFHVLELRNKDTIFTKTEKIELWKKPFSNRSVIGCLSEIAAMKFAAEMTGSRFSPFVLDVLLVYGYDQRAACALYDEMMECIMENDD